MRTHLRHLSPLAFLQQRARAVQRGLLGLILLCAATLRFYRIGASSLWSDEGNSWALLSRSFVQIARDAAADIHPPGYYWLLKLWSVPFGTSAVAMRSLSALLGLLLVYLIYRIGSSLQPAPVAAAKPPFVGPALLAAFLAALNPFQIYYSQEARMYLLLAVAGAALMLALLAYLAHHARVGRAWRALGGYVVAGGVGMWTHYTFPIVLAAAGLGFLLELRRTVPPHQRWRACFRFGLANLLVLLLYLPWLSTAVDRVLAWPAGGVDVPFFDGMQLTMAALLVGPWQHVPEPPLIWMLLGICLPLLGFLALRRWRGSYLLLLWWTLPIGLMFGLGLFSDAFLKFLLTASPAWLLLVAVAPWQLPAPKVNAAIVALGALALAVAVLPGYYSDANVRDNYAGVAAYIRATADPAQDLVLLNAPGQQEVWQYYDPGLPVLALPRQRPVDATATIATLRAATAGRRNIYALFWATAEADPARVVERWLDQHGFKGLDRWQGNVRFVIYTMADTMRCTSPLSDRPLLWGDRISLQAICRAPGQQTVAAGEALLLGLHWQSATTIVERYKVSVQLLNERDLVVEQHDSEPVGGSRPTTSWQPGERIADNHGIVLPIGTPPGNYRLIVALYNAETGVRLTVGTADPAADRDYFEAGNVQVALPAQPLPASLIPVQHTLNRWVGPLLLVGYTVHRQGFAHESTGTFAAGDALEFTFVWQAPDPLPATWPATTVVALRVGQEQITFAPAGDAYPTAAWRAGQLLQYRVLLRYDGTDRQPYLQIDQEEIALKPLPTK